MGSSYVEYKSSGFWTRDELIQFALFALAREVKEAEHMPQRLRDTVEHWIVQSQLGGSGCVSPEFDRLLPSSVEVEQLLPFLRAAAQRFAGYDEHLPPEELERAEIGGLTDWWRDHPVKASSVRNVLDAIDSLLRGHLKSPPTPGSFPLRVT